jgi:lysophospholipase L1-like esterase
MGVFHKPNAEGYWYLYDDGNKYYIKINSYGFSDSARDIRKRRPRIALIGDSVTEFWEANEEDRGQYLLESLLGKKFEVLNFGVRGYGTDRSYLLFKNTGVQFQPDIVIYTFCINDAYDNVDKRKKPYFALDQNSPSGLILKGYPLKVPLYKESFRKKITDFLVERSFIFRKFRLAKRRLFSRNSYRHLEDNFEMRLYKRTYNGADENRMEVTTRLISLLSDFTRERGMRFLVVEGLYRPVLDADQQALFIKRYGNVFDFEKVTNLLEGHCAKNKIEFLSLQKIIKAKNIKPSSLTHRSDNMHLNKLGIQLYVEAVADKLRSLGWLDDLAKQEEECKYE